MECFVSLDICVHIKGRKDIASDHRYATPKKSQVHIYLINTAKKFTSRSFAKHKSSNW
jgi:hypothetical protein